ncbi:Cobalt-zinc-cadmium resistance protein CzcC precursor [Stieleria maiorica]|uniref:Cobalt-zinc-cadmium resistance protein CzcC n=2 Tax=Stieleria maiorica TaxID=2795974 RepID=A0A5B9MDA6_9BACT|nr:Cobalt-zinc-cadmium resistance protein CzcC precursor [Stieleria maiorica]
MSIVPILHLSSIRCGCTSDQIGKDAGEIISRGGSLSVCTDAIRQFKMSLSACCLLSVVGCAQVDQRRVTPELPGQTTAPTKTPLTVRPAVHRQKAAKTSVGSLDRVNTVAYADEGQQSSSSFADHLERIALQPVEMNTVEARLESFSDLVAADVSQASAENVYTLDQLEQLALTNNPAIVAAGATATKAAGLRNQVGTRPNPTLGYFGQQLADENTDQHGVFLEQEFVRGNKLELNREVLGHTMSAQRWEMQTQRYRVLTDVRVRFYEAVAAQRRADATRNFETVARRGVQVAMERQQAEEGNLIEVLQAQTLLSEIMLAAEQAEVEYRGAWQDLAAVAGLPEAAPARLVDGPATEKTPRDWQAAYDQILSESPELSAANALVCEKYALLKRQRVQMVPNLTGQFGAGYDNATDSGMINLEFSAPIPVWNQNSGNISAAYAEYTRALEDVKRIEQSIKSRLARTAQAFDSALAAVTKYEQEIIPQTQKSLDLSEEAYRAGELEFLQVLVVRRSFFESAIRLIAAEGNLAQANAQVEGLLLTGGLDAPSDYTDGDGIRGVSFGGQ